ncbi:ribose 5-phosphate isomerase A [Thecamonas trahens ATCC 50062]|uniref:ribose-5-phosphate isomerase n=1 Tax=Thecamonas trahens ATCC 50062 TaxID=461836 RepID=A0A0L0DE94_THETB|nr:ribose 5-phosphate isomerase A [Thecamonas trahens ATCC 50062]KNC50642.1 ribose 5-phosphate isomerase A [Thecamonas trahens ATCC 50062]|eukprot:XP_013762528.1 ribose 5-phosphate isomerase A [Thecamonas trahens ATCC 50062]
MSSNGNEGVNAAKRAAAYAAVEAHAGEGMRVGVGSGSTVVFAAERLGQLAKEHGWTSVVCVPTSFQSQQLIVEAGLVLSDLNQTPELDVAFDGADEIDGELNAIKGGGAAHTQEKLVAANAKTLILLVDESKDTGALGTKWAVPIEVLPGAWVVAKAALVKAGATSVVLRMAKAKAGPVVTDNGNFVLDAAFGVIAAADVAGLEAKINNIPGVVDNGLFAGLASEVFIGRSDGSFEVRRRE